MPRYDIDNPLTDDGRNKMNSMFKELYNEYTSSGYNASEAKTLAAEAVADAILAKGIAEETRQELINIIRAQTSGEDVVPEVVQARGSEPVLGDRLDKINLELVGNAKKLRYLPNTLEPIDLITPYGDNQFTHPKMLDFGTEWNGYRYWMAYTPLPYYDESKENPCIAVSNDMVNWTLPNGMTSGLLDTPQLNDYNSDTHLVYRPDTATLEIWYRGVHEGNKTETIYRRTTKNGSDWTAREVIAGSNNGNILNFLSPAVIWDNTRKVYQIWIINNYQIQYYETPTGTNWQFIKNLTVYFGERTAAWHIDVEKTDLGYEMLISTKGQAAGVKDSLFHAVFSDMNQNSADGTKIVEPNPSGWDDDAIYRSCFLKRAGVYYVFYAGVSSKRFYGVGLSITSEINNIKSLQGTSRMYKKEVQVVNQTHYANMNAYSVSNPITDFPPYTITICAINSAFATSEGFPEPMGGMLYTYNWMYDYSFKYQMYITVTGNMYRRRLSSDNTWQNWQKANFTWGGI